MLLIPAGYASNDTKTANNRTTPIYQQPNTTPLNPSTSPFHTNHTPPSIFQDTIADSRLTLRSNSLPTNRTPNLTPPTPTPLHRNRRRHSRAMTRHRRRLQLYTSLIRLDAGDAAVETVEFHGGGCGYGCGGTGDWICWFCGSGGGGCDGFDWHEGFGEGEGEGAGGG